MRITCEATSAHRAQLGAWFAAQWRGDDLLEAGPYPEPVLALGDAGELLGGLVFTRAPLDGLADEVVWVNALYVAPRHRRQGVASCLLHAAQFQAQHHSGLKRLYAYTDLADLYLQLGWRIERTSARGCVLSHATSPGISTFTFGDSRSLCDRLLRLVRAGAKTATCDALAAFEAGGEAMPITGRRDVALNWDGSPALTIETTAVEIARFCDVDESFALAEGENDDLAGWRRDHQAYFERNGCFSPEMELVLERFELVYEFS